MKNRLIPRIVTFLIINELRGHYRGGEGFEAVWSSPGA